MGYRALQHTSATTKDDDHDHYADGPRPLPRQAPRGILEPIRLTHAACMFSGLQGSGFRVYGRGDSECWAQDLPSSSTDSSGVGWVGPFNLLAAVRRFCGAGTETTNLDLAIVLASLSRYQAAKPPKPA